jgi:hypothetical protein
MHQKHLLRFIKSKLRKEPDELVIFRCDVWPLVGWCRAVRIGST